MICSSWYLSHLIHPPQTTKNGSEDFHKKANKVRLWNSLELSNTLTVDNVTVDHTGEYTCTASSGQMEKSASAFLKVYGRPCANLMPRPRVSWKYTHAMKILCNPLLNVIITKVKNLFVYNANEVLMCFTSLWFSESLILEGQSFQIQYSWCFVMV